MHFFTEIKMGGRGSHLDKDDPAFDNAKAAKIRWQKKIDDIANKDWNPYQNVVDFEQDFYGYQFDLIGSLDFAKEIQAEFECLLTCKDPAPMLKIWEEKKNKETKREIRFRTILLLPDEDRFKGACDYSKGEVKAWIRRAEAVSDHDYEKVGAQTGDNDVDEKTEEVHNSEKTGDNEVGEKTEEVRNSQKTGDNDVDEKAVQVGEKTEEVRNSEKTGDNDVDEKAVQVGEKTEEVRNSEKTGDNDVDEKAVQVGEKTEEVRNSEKTGDNDVGEKMQKKRKIDVGEKMKKKRNFGFDALGRIPVSLKNLVGPKSIW